MKNSVSVVPIPVLKDNYVWTLIDDKTKNALIVDPGVATPVMNYLKKNKLSLLGMLITHHHWDHTNGIVELQQNCDGLVFGPLKDYVASVTNPLEENEEVEIEGFPLHFRVIEIPGHTLGHCAYYSPGMLFCGDTLFAAGCGRVFEGTPDQMYATLQKIAALPDDTKIYCGHEYTLNNLRFAETVEPGNKKIAERIKKVTEIRNKGLPSLPSTIAEEKATNPFLRCDSPELIKSVEKHAGKKLNGPIEVFTWLRQWKDHF